MSWNLAQIRERVRSVVGRLSSGDLTNDQIDTEINRFYQYTFPAEVKLDREETYYEFLTTPNQPWYDLPNSTYTNFSPPATVNNLMMLWYQNPAKFEEENPKQYNTDTSKTGDGSTVSFTYTVTGYPIMPDSVVITDNTETFEDTTRTYTTSNVTITGSEGGTASVNYSTGAISVTFNTAPANGQTIYLNYIVFNAGRPQAVLFYNNQIELFPIPDTAYKFRCKAFAIPTALSAGTDSPALPEWGLAIAYGTARDILAQYGEIDAYAKINILYQEQLNYVLTRTTENLLNTRALPQF